MSQAREEMTRPSHASCMFGFYQSSRGRKPGPRRRRKPHRHRAKRPTRDARAPGNQAPDDDKRWPLEHVTAMASFPAMQNNHAQCYNKTAAFLANPGKSHKREAGGRAPCPMLITHIAASDWITLSTLPLRTLAADLDADLTADKTVGKSGLILIIQSVGLTCYYAEPIC